MNYRAEIEKIFEGKAFIRPLFYNYAGGLRFELSEGGDFINQFTTAHRKAIDICRFVFSDSENITVCVKIFGGKSVLSILQSFRELKNAGLYPTNDKQHWTVFDAEWGDDETYSNSSWHYIAFSIPIELLPNVLWCALATDIVCIEPRVEASFYLFDLKQKLMVWPYDDRGMDIVGPNHHLLSSIYNKFNNYLLDYDRDEMNAVFEK